MAASSASLGCGPDRKTTHSVSLVGISDPQATHGSPGSRSLTLSPDTLYCTGFHSREVPPAQQFSTCDLSSWVLRPLGAGGQNFFINNKSIGYIAFLHFAG
jgi:hypothetical protein